MRVSVSYVWNACVSLAMCESWESWMSNMCSLISRLLDNMFGCDTQNEYYPYIMWLKSNQKAGEEPGNKAMLLMH